MRRLSKILAVALLSTLSIPQAIAGVFTLDNGSFGTVTVSSGTATVPKIANKIGTDLYISIDHDDASIEQRTKNGGKQMIASGKTFDMHFDKENDESQKLHGYCFLTAGDELTQIIGEKANTADLVLCIDGQKFAGNIVTVDKDILSIRENNVVRLVRVVDIRSIVSARVLRISAHVFPVSGAMKPVTAAIQVKILRFEVDETLDDFMTAAGKKKLETAIDAAGYTKLQRAALIGASVLVTGAAIAVPVAVAVPLAGRHQTAQKAPPSQLEVVQH